MMNLQQIKKIFNPTPENISYEAYYRLFRYVCFLRYSTPEQLIRTGFSGCSKVCTDGKLKYLADKGFLEYENGTVKANKMSIDIASSVNLGGYLNINLFSSAPTGYGDINQLTITDAVIECMKLPDYYFILYPNFEYIIPDGLLVLRKNNAYKLCFLEVERKKPNWADYLETKRQNYLRLAKDNVVYDYWCEKAELLGFPIPQMKELKFCVWIFSSVNFDFGKGFNFYS